MEKHIHQRVYTVEVEGFCTCHVGKDGIWFHDARCPKPTTPAQEPACFLAGTLVHTKEGKIEIEHVEVGTEVLSRCEKTGVIDFRPVTETFYHRVSMLCAVSFIHDDGFKYSIITTSEHPFWVQDTGWRPAAQLLGGDRLFIYDDFDKSRINERHFDRNWAAPPRDPSGASLVTVLESRAETTLSPTGDSGVYNFKVEEFHTYFVGDAGIWVHNTKAVEPTRLLLGCR